MLFITMINQYECVVSAFSRAWIDRIWLSILLVVIRKIIFSQSPFAPDNSVTRDKLSRPVPRQPAHFPHRLNLMPSGQSRVYQATQMRIDGVDCR